MSAEPIGVMNVHKRIRDISNWKGPVGLDRMRRLLELMGNPEKTLKIIHVGGTNGKGSTSHFIKSILEAENYNVGIFTSPHLVVFNERIQTSQGMISDEDFERIANKVMDNVEVLNHEGFGFLSQFEILTATAYAFFAEIQPDYVIMEVGIGGRYDATNAVDNSLVTVISQIGIDHVSTLGDTLSLIAGEKACIIKEGVPLISTSKELEVKEVLFNEAKHKSAPVIDCSTFDYSIIDSANKAGNGYTTIFDACICDKKFESLQISMLGEHQIANSIAAIAAVMQIIDVSESAIRIGLLAARNPGRFEFLRYQPDFIIDGAHNESGIKSAIAAFESVEGSCKDKKVLVGFGCLADKDVNDMVSLISRSFKGADIVALEPNSERALSSKKLHELFVKNDRNCDILTNIGELFSRKNAKKYDIIIVLGSIYLIGEVRALFLKKYKEL